MNDHISEFSHKIISINKSAIEKQEHFLFTTYHVGWFTSTAETSSTSISPLTSSVFVACDSNSLNLSLRNATAYVRILVEISVDFEEAASLALSNKD